MSSRAQQKEQARQERMRREAEEAARKKRRQSLTLIGAGGVVAAIVVVALILISQGGSSSGNGNGGGGGSSGTSARVAKELAGIPQQGGVLGSANAKVTMTEFGDLQCPACKAYSANVSPQVVANYAQPGKVKLVFNNWLIIGPDSKPAGEASLAAGRQGKMWQFNEIFYLEQLQENSGYVTDGFLTKVAKQVKGLDIAKWQQDRKDTKALDAQLRAINNQANNNGFNQTPSFLIQPRGRPAQPFGGSTVPTYDQVKAALDQALAQAK